MAGEIGKIKKLVGDCWTITFENVSQRAIGNPDNVWTWGGITGNTDSLITQIEGFGGTFEIVDIYNAEGQLIADIQDICICIPCKSFDNPPSATLAWSFLNGSRTGVWGKKECPIKPCPTEFQPYCVEARISCVTRDNGWTPGATTNTIRNNFIRWDEVFSESSINLNGQDCDTGDMVGWPSPPLHLQAWADKLNAAYAEKGLADKNFAARFRFDPRTFFAVKETSIDPNVVFGNWSMTYADPKTGEEQVALVHPVLPTEEIVTGWYYFTHDGCDEDGVFQNKKINWCVPDPDNPGSFTPGEAPTWKPDANGPEVEIPFSCFKPCGFNFDNILAENASSECTTGQPFEGCEIQPATTDDDGNVTADAEVVVSGLLGVWEFCPGEGWTLFTFSLDEENNLVPHDMADGNGFGDCETLMLAEPPTVECPEGTLFEDRFFQKEGSYVDNSTWLAADGSPAPTIHLNNAVQGDLSADILDTHTGVTTTVTAPFTGSSTWVQLGVLLGLAGCNNGRAIFNHTNGTPDNPIDTPAYFNQSPAMDEVFATARWVEWCSTQKVQKIYVSAIQPGTDPGWLGAYRPLTVYEGPKVKIRRSIGCSPFFFEDCNGETINDPGCKTTACNDVATLEQPIEECLNQIKDLFEDIKGKPCPKLVQGAPQTIEALDGAVVLTGLFVTPKTAPQGVLCDHVIPIILEDPCGCLDDCPDETKLRVRYNVFGHNLHSDTTGYNIEVVSSPTGERSPGAMLVGESENNTYNNSPNAGTGIGGVGVLSGEADDSSQDRFIEFDIPKGELKSGVALRTCGFGGVSPTTAIETMQGFSVEMVTDFNSLGCECDSGCPRPSASVPITGIGRGESLTEVALRTTGATTEEFPQEMQEQYVAESKQKTGEVLQSFRVSKGVVAGPVLINGEDLTSTVGEAVKQPFIEKFDDESITEFCAEGLPGGLEIDQETGIASGTPDPGLQQFQLSPESIILNGADVSGTTVDGIQVGDEIRMANVGEILGKAYDIIVVIDDIQNLDDNGLIQLDADPAGSPNIVVRDNVANNAYVVFTVTFVEAGTSEVCPIECDISMRLSDIDSGDGQDITEVVGARTGSYNSVDIGSNLHQGTGFTNTTAPGGFDYFEVNPALAGDPTNWIDEINESSNDDTNLSFNYSGFTSEQYVMGASGSHSGTSGRGFGLARFDVTKPSAAEGGPNGDGVYPVSVIAKSPAGEVAECVFDWTITPLDEGSDGGDGNPFTPSGDLQVQFFNEQQFAFGFDVQNTTDQPISGWATQIANANYELDAAQLTNNAAFDLVSVDNGDGTFTHTFVGLVDIPPFASIPGGAIQWNSVNFGFAPTSDGLVTGTGGG